MDCILSTSCAILGPEAGVAVNMSIESSNREEQVLAADRRQLERFLQVLAEEQLASLHELA